MENKQNASQEDISTLKQKYEELKQKYEVLRSKAGEEWSHIKEKMHVYGEGTEEFIDSVGRYIKENPQRSTIIAASIGFGIGLILGLIIKGDKK